MTINAGRKTALAGLMLGGALVSMATFRVLGWWDLALDAGIILLASGSAVLMGDDK